MNKANNEKGKLNKNEGEKFLTKEVDNKSVKLLTVLDFHRK